ncbi:hypothetical protein J1N35_015917 [Gossypium stocksii]|uniref:Reverse transcriptase zinc-binding domain-containing protein n=1 Tax=Gossypium stocksii TaxID=47602 RepID=A0A9D3VZI1_9ROSI|nr:hypothetical protein J1N35_015917 [Gossypium stocksii]
MESIIANFWWQKGRGKKGIHWRSWKNMCLLKDYGSLGFQNFCQFNILLLAKQGWHLFSCPNSLLARVLKAKYFPHSKFLNAQLGRLPSFTWKSIWAARGLLQDGLGWRVGRASEISIWNDYWILGGDVVGWQNREGNGDLRLVSDLIDNSTRTWKREIVNNTFPTEIARKILQIPLAEAEHEDFRVWKEEPSRVFSVRSAYKLLQCASMDSTSYLLRTEIEAFFKKLWDIQLPTKITILV